MDFFKATRLFYVFVFQTTYGFKYKLTKFCSQFVYGIRNIKHEYLILQEEASKFSRYPNTSVAMASYDTIEDEDELHKLVSRS